MVNKIILFLKLLIRNGLIYSVVLTTLLFFTSTCLSLNSQASDKNNLPLTTTGHKNPTFDGLLIKANSTSGIKFAQKNNVQRPNNKALRDTSKNKITSLRESPDGEAFLLNLELEDYSIPIEIEVRNLLGKKILPVWSELPRAPDYDYEIPITNLPDGVYLCIVSGRSFTSLYEKFIVSR
jgi:hypothetical protein